MVGNVRFGTSDNIVVGNEQLQGAQDVVCGSSSLSQFDSYQWQTFRFQDGDCLVEVLEVFFICLMKNKVSSIDKQGWIN